MAQPPPPPPPSWQRTTPPRGPGLALIVGLTAMRADNPIADAMVDRAAALAVGDRHGVLASAVALKDAGCRYQWARTMVLAGGPERIRGAAVLAEMGAIASDPSPAGLAR